MEDADVKLQGIHRGAGRVGVVDQEMMLPIGGTRELMAWCVGAASRLAEANSIDREALSSRQKEASKMVAYRGGELERRCVWKLGGDRNEVDAGYGLALQREGTTRAYVRPTPSPPIILQRTRI